MSLKNYTVHTIERQDAKPWIMKKHYAERMPSVVHAFGLFKNQICVGICTYGIPPSNNLCEGVCGKEFKKNVIELNRVCLEDNKKNEASFLIAKSLKLLPAGTVVVSYADTGKNHIGYIYQATNWLYTGLSAKRTDPDIDIGNKHGRHEFVRGKNQKNRSRKHRYVYFVGSKKQKKEMRSNLQYPIDKYPKGESKRYDTSAEFPKQVQLFG